MAGWRSGSRVSLLSQFWGRHQSVQGGSWVFLTWVFLNRRQKLPPQRKQGKRVARESVLVCLSEVYTVAFPILTQLFFLFPVLFYRKNLHLFCSPIQRVCECVKTRISAAIDLLVWGVQIKKIQRKLKGWLWMWSRVEKWSCFFSFWIRQSGWTATSGTPTRLRSHLPPCMGSDGCILLQ